MSEMGSLLTVHFLAIRNVLCRCNAVALIGRWNVFEWKLSMQYQFALNFCFVFENVRLCVWECARHNKWQKRHTHSHTPVLILIICTFWLYCNISIRYPSLKYVFLLFFFSPACVHPTGTESSSPLLGEESSISPSPRNIFYSSGIPSHNTADNSNSNGQSITVKPTAVSSRFQISHWSDWLWGIVILMCENVSHL